MRRRAGAIDQQRLGRAADAGAAHLGVEHDRLRHLEIGGAIDIDMADAFEMREHRHARFVLHARDKALAAARHDHVDAAVKPAQHLADRGAVAGRHQLDRLFRQAGLAQALRPGRRGSRAQERKLSEPPRRITALPALRHSAPASAVTFGRLSKITPMTPSGVRTRSMFRPLGRSQLGDRRRPDRRGCGDFDAVGHRLDARLRQRQPVEEGGRGTSGAGISDIVGIGGENRSRMSSRSRAPSHRAPDFSAPLEQAPALARLRAPACKVAHQRPADRPSASIAFSGTVIQVTVSIRLSCTVA